MEGYEDRVFAWLGTEMADPKVALLERFDPHDVARALDVFSEDVVWHFFNPLMPDVEGDYVGHGGLQDFFVVGRVAEVWDIPSVHAATR